jgi:ketosteroid isomerase-like protein
MKKRLLFVIAGSIIGLALPVVAQEQNTVDPEVRRQIEALIVKFDEAYNRSDAVAIADLFTPDAVQVWEWESAGGVASVSKLSRRGMKPSS